MPMICTGRNHVIVGIPLPSDTVVPPTSYRQTDAACWARSPSQR